MPRFAANLTMMYVEHAFMDRFDAAADDGFEAVEFAFAYDHPKEDVATRLAGRGLKQVLMNAPPGDFLGGERGIACLPGRREEFRRGILAQALPYALALKCPRLHVMAGVMPPGVPRAALRDEYLANLDWVANEAASVGIEVLIEPINKRDIPGYLLNRQDDAHEIASEIDRPNLKVQMDLYHCQVVEGDVAMKLRKYLPAGRVGHLQIAGVPDRNEPDRGELYHPYLFEVIDELGYDGHVGCEYRPRGRTSEGLDWLRRLQDPEGDAR